MSNEDQKITNLIHQHRDFLSANHIDIAHSALSDTWFVYRYDQNYHYYEYFIEFTTAEQLVNIILEEFRFLLCSAIEDILEIPNFEESALAELVNNYQHNTNLHAEIAALLNIISTHKLSRNAKFIHTLEALFEVNTAKNTSSQK